MIHEIGRIGLGWLEVRNSGLLASQVMRTFLFLDVVPPSICPNLRVVSRTSALFLLPACHGQLYFGIGERHPSLTVMVATMLTRIKSKTGVEILRILKHKGVMQIGRGS